MPPRRKPASKAPVTTQARLSAIIKESRNIMRKDAGLNGDLDRLPQMAWLLFLKAFDDLEVERQMADPDYRPVIDEEYRWRIWAGGKPSERRTGDALTRFVNGKLLPHLAQLQGSGKVGDPRDTLGTVFRDVQNRMLSGYLLRDLVNQLNQVNFASNDDIHTMAHLYESMLREMRDAAGDSGEFYTPRPLIRFIVDRIDPRPGERVLDPAVGTGGFLVEAFEHMHRHVANSRQMEQVKAKLTGVEKKPLPFLLCEMNLLLHGIDRPNVVRDNALANPIAQMRRQTVDVVVTNPPFGGEEEAHIPENFPVNMRTAETSWLFLQLVMARLEKGKNARCGIVVPNGVLSAAGGVGARIKAELFGKFNLHTVLRLPNGVFSPYTPIPSNVLFFEKGKQGDHIWSYDHPLPEGRKNYTKTKPLRFEEFDDCATWWGGRSREGRVENERAWQVSTESVVASGYNLDLHNPHRPDDLAHRPPAEIVKELIENEHQMLELLQQLQSDVESLNR